MIDCAMLVIFLDIDGVLNSDRYLNERLLKHPDMAMRLDPACCALLNDVLAATGAKIVISSDWRYKAEDRDIEAMLHRRGALCAEVIGRTPNIVRKNEGDPAAAMAWIAAQVMAGVEIQNIRDGYPWSDRGDEIRHWLQHSRIQVERFAIIDDCDDMQRLRDRLVQTNPSVGLTQPDVDRAMAMLRDP
jgi:hypothetical protein